MATKKAKEAAKSEKKVKDPEKEAKRKARMEALKNRPEGQRPNSKQIDVIEVGNSKVLNFGYPIKNKEGYQGVLVTSVLTEGDKVIGSSVSFVAGNLTVKSKKGHGTICSPKNKKNKEEDSDKED